MGFEYLHFYTLAQIFYLSRLVLNDKAGGSGSAAPFGYAQDKLTNQGQKAGGKRFSSKFTFRYIVRFICIVLLTQVSSILSHKLCQEPEGFENITRTILHRSIVKRSPRICFIFIIAIAAFWMCI